MKNFPGAYVGEKNRKTGAKPVWILKLTIGGSAYYLSGSAFTVTPWSVTTLPWVRTWGSVQEGITGFLEEFQIANFDCGIIIDRSATPNMESLTLNNEIEESAASLYCWFRGCYAPPQEFFRGYVRECSMDDTIVNLSFQDETIRLERNYIGTRVDRSTYPSADPDDIGKVIPIVYGTVNKLATLAVDAGVLTTLPSAITAVATSFSVSDATGLTNGLTLVCDQEEMTVTGVSGDTVNVARGANTTVAAAHQRGASIWQKKSEFVYMVADHTVDSISKVYGRVGEGLLDITAISTRYSAGDHPSYPGKAVITIPGYVTVEQAVNLLISDGIGVNDAKSLVDGIGVADGISISDLIAIIDPGHSHNAALSTNENSSTGMPTADSVYYGDRNQGCYIDVAFPSYGARSTVSYSFTINPKCTANSVRVRAIVNGSAYYDQYYNLVSGSGFSFTFSVNGDIRVDTVTIVFSGYNFGLLFNVTAASRTIQLTANQSSSNSASVGKSGSVSKAGTVTKSGTASLSGSVTKTGTVTLSGNSVANTMIGDQVLVNVTRSISTPAAVVSGVLGMVSFPAVSTVGTIPTLYAFNGAITEYKPALYWLNYFALQCRCFFKVSCGVPRLILRPSSISPIKTISACRVDSEGRRQLKRQKMAFSQIINVMNLLYNRDWSKDRSAGGYNAVSKGENSTSISSYGRIENAGLFWFDFVTSQTMADDLRDYYLTACGSRPWDDEFEVYLDHSELEFSDHVSIGFLSVNGYVIKSEQYPGDSSKIDMVKLTVREV